MTTEVYSMTAGDYNMIASVLAFMFIWFIPFTLIGVVGFNIGKNKGYREVLNHGNKERTEKKTVTEQDEQDEEDGYISSSISECGLCGADSVEFEPHEQAVGANINRNGKLYHFDDVLRERNTREYQ